MAPPPASFLSQNQALWGPEWVSRDLTHRTLPTAPALTDATDFERLGRVDEVLEVAREHAGLLHGLEDLERLGGAAAERLGAEHRLAGVGGERDGFLMEEVGDADDHDVGFRVLDGLFHVGRPVRDTVFLGESLGLGLGHGADRLNPVPAPAAVDGHGVERADQAGAEQGDVMRFFHGASRRDGMSWR